MDAQVAQMLAYSASGKGTLRTHQTTAKPDPLPLGGGESEERAEEASAAPGIDGADSERRFQSSTSGQA